MGQLKSLENVNALALSAKVLVLLSKYAQVIRVHNGTVLKLSSLRIFKHIHETCESANSPKLNKIYQQLLDEVNLHINAGTMYTNDAKESMLRVKKKTPLKKYLDLLSHPAKSKETSYRQRPSVDY